MRKAIILIAIAIFMLVSSPAWAGDVSIPPFGEGITAASTAGAGASSDLTMTGSKVPMSVIAQDLKFPQLIPYFGPKNPGYRFWPLADLLLYQNTFTLGSLQNGFTDRELKANGLIRITNGQAIKQIMTVIYNKPANGQNSNVRDERYLRMGYVGALVKGDYTSIQALRLMLLVANKMGAKVVHATRQGIEAEMYAKGWGISIGGVSGYVSVEGDSGKVASGMLGWATGKAGANKDPWIQGVALEPRP